MVIWLLTPVVLARRARLATRRNINTGRRWLWRNINTGHHALWRSINACRRIPQHNVTTGHRMVQQLPRPQREIQALMLTANQLCFTRSALRKLKAIPFRLVISHDVLGLDAAVALARHNRCPLCVDVVETPVLHERTGEFFRENLNQEAMIYFNNIIQGHLRSADFLLSVSPTLARETCESIGKPCTVILNVRERTIAERSDYLRRNLNIAPETPVIVSVGLLTKDSGIEQLVTAAAAMPQGPTIVHVGGRPQGALGDTVHSLIDKHEMNSRFFWHDRVAYDQVLHVISSADMGYIGFRPNHMNLVAAMPNRMFDYIAAGLPILTSQIGDVANFVKKHKIGEVFEWQHDGRSLGIAITRILAKNEKLKAVAWQLRERLSWQAEVNKLTCMPVDDGPILIIGRKRLHQNQRAIKMARYFADLGHKVFIGGITVPRGERNRIKTLLLEQ